jgi:GT2 family glycosyltransferase
MRVVVVDNDSGDGSAEQIGAWAAAHGGGAAVVVPSPRNVGFGAGCNLAIERALAMEPAVRHVLLVNPDAAARPGMTAALLDCARRNPSAAIVGGLVLAGDGRTPWFENGAWKPWTLGPSHVAAPGGEEEYDTPFVTGALMLLDAALLRAGLRFDERYFLYCEDMDLCRQVLARGRTLRITRKAVLVHRHGGTQRSEPAVLGGMRRSQLRFITQNKVLLARKWLTPQQRVTAALVAWVLRPIAGILVFRSLGFLPTYFRALVEGTRVP